MKPSGVVTKASLKLMSFCSRLGRFPRNAASIFCGDGCTLTLSKTSVGPARSSPSFLEIYGSVHTVMSHMNIYTYLTIHFRMAKRIKEMVVTASVTIATAVINKTGTKMLAV